MAKITKKQKTLVGKVDSNKLYPLADAIGHREGGRHGQVR